WQLAGVLLLVFASILLAIALRAAGNGIARLTGVGEPIGLAIAAMLIVAVAVVGGFVFGSRLAAQIADLVDRVPAMVDQIRGQLSGTRIGDVIISHVDS